MHGLTPSGSWDVHPEHLVNQESQSLFPNSETSGIVIFFILFFILHVLLFVDHQISVCLHQISLFFSAESFFPPSPIRVKMNGSQPLCWTMAMTSRMTLTTPMMRTMKTSLRGRGRERARGRVAAWEKAWEAARGKEASQEAKCASSCLNHTRFSGRRSAKNHIHLHPNDKYLSVATLGNYSVV